MRLLNVEMHEGRLKSDLVIPDLCKDIRRQFACLIISKNFLRVMSLSSSLDPQYMINLEMRILIC